MRRNACHQAVLHIFLNPVTSHQPLSRSSRSAVDNSTQLCSPSTPSWRTPRQVGGQMSRQLRMLHVGRAPGLDDNWPTRCVEQLLAAWLPVKRVTFYEALRSRPPLVDKLAAATRSFIRIASTQAHFLKKPLFDFTGARPLANSAPFVPRACFITLGASLSSLFFSTRYTVDPTLSSLGARSSLVSFCSIAETFLCFGLLSPKLSISIASGSGESSSESESRNCSSRVLEPGWRSSSSSSSLSESELATCPSRELVLRLLDFLRRPACSVDS